MTVCDSACPAFICLKRFHSGDTDDVFDRFQSRCWQVATDRLQCSFISNHILRLNPLMVFRNTIEEIGEIFIRKRCGITPNSITRLVEKMRVDRLFKISFFGDRQHWLTQRESLSHQLIPRVGNQRMTTDQIVQKTGFIDFVVIQVAVTRFFPDEVRPSILVEQIGEDRQADADHPQDKPAEVRAATAHQPMSHFHDRDAVLARRRTR